MGQASIGDLVRVKSTSLTTFNTNYVGGEAYLNLGDRVPRYSPSYHSVSMTIEEPKYIDVIGEITHIYRDFVFTVWSEGRTFRCLPDEIELVFTK